MSDKLQIPCYIALSRTHMHIFHSIKNEVYFLKFIIFLITNINLQLN